MKLPDEVFTISDVLGPYNKENGKKWLREKHQVERKAIMIGTRRVPRGRPVNVYTTSRRRYLESNFY